MLTGENGLLTKAEEAVEKSKYVEAEEKVKLAVLEYHTNMKEKTMYSILTRIQGFEGITPDDENAGMPYDVIVDGYIFTVKENEETKDIEVEYKGKSNGIKPEIISISATNVNDKEAKITVQAKTKDEAGIEKVILLKDGLQVDEKEVEGTNITADFTVKGNGEYKVVVIGKNLMRIESEVLQVSGLITISGTISAGTVIDGGVLLTITGYSTENNITNVEIYEGQTKLGEIPIEEQTKEIEKKYQIEYMAFYETKNYHAKIISENNPGVETNLVNVCNQNSIKTKADLIKFASLVSGGETFYSKTIKLIANINSIGNFQAIGYGQSDEVGFNGTFDGNFNILSGVSISSSCTNLGLFTTLQKNATVKNLILKDCNITNNKTGDDVDYYVGGIAGLSLGKIENCAYIGNISYSRVYKGRGKL